MPESVRGSLSHTVGALRIFKTDKIYMDPVTW